MTHVTAYITVTSQKRVVLFYFVFIDNGKTAMRWESRQHLLWTTLTLDKQLHKHKEKGRRRRVALHLHTHHPGVWMRSVTQYFLALKVFKILNYLEGLFFTSATCEIYSLPSCCPTCQEVTWECVTPWETAASFCASQAEMTWMAWKGLTGKSLHPSCEQRPQVPCGAA